MAYKNLQEYPGNQGYYGKTNLRIYFFFETGFPKNLLLRKEKNIKKNEDKITENV